MMRHYLENPRVCALSIRSRWNALATTANAMMGAATKRNPATGHGAGVGPHSQGAQSIVAQTARHRNLHSGQSFEPKYPTWETE